MPVCSGCFHFIEILFFFLLVLCVITQCNLDVLSSDKLILLSC